MANAGWTGPEGHPSSGYGMVRGYIAVEWWEDSDYFYFRIYDGGSQMMHGYNYGLLSEHVVREPGAGDHIKVNLTGVINHNPGGTWTWVTGWHGGPPTSTSKIAKRNTTNSVEVAVRVSGTTVNGYGPWNGDTDYAVVATIPIPARVMTPIPTPEVTADDYEPVKNQSITIYAVGGTPTSNANFARWEVTNGIWNKYGNTGRNPIDGSDSTYVNATGAGTSTVPSLSLTVNPSIFDTDEYVAGVNDNIGEDLPGIVPIERGTVIYAVREFHEWYGTYPYHPSVWVVVNIKSGKVTYYDGNGTPIEGLAHLYDSNGALKNVEGIYYYDDNGVLRESL